MDEATRNENDALNDNEVDMSEQTHLTIDVEDTIEKPKKRKPTKKQLESLEKARKRKSELQKQRRNDAKQTQQLMNSYVEQNTFNTGLKEEIGSLRRQMEEMRGRLDARFEPVKEEVESESEYETDSDEEYPEAPRLVRQQAYKFV